MEVDGNLRAPTKGPNATFLFPGLEGLMKGLNHHWPLDSHDESSWDG